MRVWDSQGLGCELQDLGVSGEGLSTGVVGWSLGCRDLGARGQGLRILMEKSFSSNLSGNEVHCTKAFL